MPIPSLQSLLLETVAAAIVEPRSGFTAESLEGLSGDLCERLQQILIQRNALTDATLVMTTSARQTSLYIPFSMTMEDVSISTTSVLEAMTVRPSCSPFPPHYIV